MYNAADSIPLIEEMEAWASQQRHALQSILDDPTNDHGVRGAISSGGLRVAHVIGLYGELSIRRGGPWSTHYEGRLQGGRLVARRPALSCQVPLPQTGWKSAAMLIRVRLPRSGTPLPSPGLVIHPPHRSCNMLEPGVLSAGVAFGGADRCRTIVMATAGVMGSTPLGRRHHLSAALPQQQVCSAPLYCRHLSPPLLVYHTFTTNPLPPSHQCALLCRGVPRRFRRAAARTPTTSSVNILIKPMYVLSLAGHHRHPARPSMPPDQSNRPTAAVMIELHA